MTFLYGLYEALLAPIWEWIGPLVKVVIFLIVVAWLLSAHGIVFSCDAHPGDGCF